MMSENCWFGSNLHQRFSVSAGQKRVGAAVVIGAVRPNGYGRVERVIVGLDIDHIVEPFMREERSISGGVDGAIKSIQEIQRAGQMLSSIPAEK